MTQTIAGKAAELAGYIKPNTPMEQYFRDKAGKWAADNFEAISALLSSQEEANARVGQLERLAYTAGGKSYKSITMGAEGRTRR